jgi:putative ATPase
VDLFDHVADQERFANAPLADRMRPHTLDDVIGQDAVCGPDTFLGKAILADRLPSLLLWGPPGSGKTTLAAVVAETTSMAFVSFSAVLGGVKDVRRIVADAQERQRLTAQRTLLFVDEIHRFNKAQQDAFLPHVERGTVVLVGATTENPSFEVNSALRSRLRVIRLTRLEPNDLVEILTRAMAAEHGLRGRVHSEEGPLLRIAGWADGDARRALNMLEAAAAHAEDDQITDDVIVRVMESGGIRHDKSGDDHYDVVSALIKSMRGSDVDASLYYLARMLEGGENPRFLLRRLIIFASEDIGNADPRALQLTVTGAQGFDRVGMPEGRIILAQLCTFLATAPKSNRSYVGLETAASDVKETGALEVPFHLRNAPTGLEASLGYGQGYRYPHNYGGYVNQQYLPDALEGRVFYEPSQNGYEARIAQWLDRQRAPTDGQEGDDSDSA